MCAANLQLPALASAVGERYKSHGNSNFIFCAFFHRIRTCACCIVTSQVTVVTVSYS